ncbi:hypothetical protein [Nesterenkonia sp. Act20]|uniref:hypothetical protein n=1 Tax=Nesterenkonia sp. Act20 TaxID=1483432 RepID=UPI001C46AD73|nr:hypothetical protein [Nesterenkonia sp. Act20]
MSSTPEGNRPPEQPRWGQRNPAPGEPGHHPQPQPDASQPAYGQHQNPAAPYAAAPAGYYAQQPGQGMAQTDGQPTPGQKPKRPMTMILALVLMLLAGAAALTLSILSFLNFISVNPADIDPFWTEAFEEAQAQQGADAEQVTMEEMLYVVGVMVLLGGILLAVLYTVFAFVGTITGNVGRILATIFLAGSVFMILFGPLNLIVTGLSLAAIVALWLPASNNYIRSRKAWKQRPRGGPYGDPQPQGGYAAGNPQQQWQQPGGPGEPVSRQQGPYDQGPYQPGPYDHGPYQPGPYQPGPHQQGPYQQDPYNPDAGSNRPDEDPRNPYGGSTRR